MGKSTDGGCSGNWILDFIPAFIGIVIPIIIIIYYDIPFI